VNDRSDLDLSGTGEPSQELRDWLVLNLISGIGPRLRQSLLEHFGSVAEILAASPAHLRDVPGVGPKLARKVVAARDDINVDQEIALCREHRIDIIPEIDPRFPRMLREIPDPPGLLYCAGNLLPQDNLAIAIVGTRHASRYGLDQAASLASGLARAGMTIVSGMARGIDGAAHRAALAAGGRTIAVLGSGLLEIYPPEHKELSAEIAAHGAVVSEAPLRRPPKGDAFPQRNRIVTGICLGVIVIEAAARSGALISARLANEQGREVFALPGRVDSRLSTGCHRLIRDGAKLVENVDDVLEELGPLVSPTADEAGNSVHHPGELQLNEQERAVLQHIEVDPIEIDLLARLSGLPIGRVLSTISVLEMRRLIRRVTGTAVCRR
jgi:DNA processing protein